MKTLIATSILLLAFAAHAQERTAAESLFKVQDGSWGNYPACNDDSNSRDCANGYICWGNQCLPEYCHMGCADNSPCWPDGTCNYGE